MLEPLTVCEPHTLTEERVKRDLLNKLEKILYRISNKGPKSNPFKPLFRGGELILTPGEDAYLWTRSKKDLSTEYGILNSTFN